MVAVRVASDDFGQFHLHFASTSGLNLDHPVPIKHYELLTILLHLTWFDQFNVTQLAGTRHALQVH